MNQTLWRTWLPILGLLGGIVLVMYLLMSPAPTAPGDLAIVDGDHIFGNSKGEIVLIEYSDFQCPACRVVEPTLKTLREKYPDKLSFVYRHFPLKPLHKYAELAAKASEAAALQGKFWEMHDMLFDRQAAWSLNASEETFIGYARELGLDTEKFKSDLQSSEVAAKVSRDLQGGEAAKIQGTPTLFLNGQQLQFRTLDELVKIIEQAINEKYSSMGNSRPYYA